MKRTPKNIELNIINEYLSGLTMDQTADKCGVTKFVVFRTLKSYNIQARPGRIYGKLFGRRKKILK